MTMLLPPGSQGRNARLSRGRRLEKLLSTSEPPLKCSDLAAQCRPKSRAPASIPDVGRPTGGYIWFASGLFFFPEELAGSSIHGNSPRAASGSNGIFLPSQSRGVGFCFILLVWETREGKHADEGHQTRRDLYHIYI